MIYERRKRREKLCCFYVVKGEGGGEKKKYKIDKTISHPFIQLFVNLFNFYLFIVFLMTLKYFGDE